MALVVTGTRTTSGGILSSIRKHSLRINLKPAKKISIQFDPFGDNSRNLRYVFNVHLNTVETVLFKIFFSKYVWILLLQYLNINNSRDHFKKHVKFIDYRNSENLILFKECNLPHWPQP